MIELRYNGCPDCLKSAQTVLRKAGYFPTTHYKIEFHSDHAKDPIYTVRPDYLDVFSGAILYNPDSQHWLDFYDKEHLSVVLKSGTQEEKKRFHTLFEALKDGA